MPRENSVLFGHAAGESVFQAAQASGRLHHAWLISGAEGIGKATLAFRFARSLLSGGRPPHDPASPGFRRVAQGTHADLLTVERDYDEKRKRQRTEIVVDDARDIAGFLRLTPAEGGWRVVVVDGAEFLNRNAANALLKVLEEPPSRAVLLLTCAAPGRLLPTIRSRCRRLALTPLTDLEMDRTLALVLPGEDAAARSRLIALAAGSPGRAAMLAEAGGIAIAALVDTVLQDAPSIPITRAYEVADRLARTDGAYSTFMDVLRDRIGVSIRQAARSRPDALSAMRPLGEWSEVWHALGRLQDETERSNLDKRHAIVAGLDLLNAR
ncbi:MAG: DNA polymerase III subunit delta' [Pseudomonadota bacterium]|nr:DNA polymerase III subunit delta' [Pseudomonadota bacterium]